MYNNILLRSLNNMVVWLDINTLANSIHQLNTKWRKFLHFAQGDIIMNIMAYIGILFLKFDIAYALCLYARYVYILWSRSLYVYPFRCSSYEFLVYQVKNLQNIIISWKSDVRRTFIRRLKMKWSRTLKWRWSEMKW